MDEEFVQERISNLDRIAHYIIPIITAVGDYMAIVLAEKIVWELTYFVLGEKFNLIIHRKCIFTFGYLLYLFSFCFILMHINE